ncbi:MAG: acetyl-CoA carboxylase biotin carboxyl carrier protein [Candidatus Limnocylindrales bacterium]
MTTTDALLALIDRLEVLLERSGLAELKVEAGDLEIMLRKPGVSGAGGALEVVSSARAGEGRGAAIDASWAAPAQPGSSQPGSANPGASPAGSADWGSSQAESVAAGAELAVDSRAARANVRAGDPAVGLDAAGAAMADTTAMARAANPDAADSATVAGAVTHAVLAPLTGIYYAAPSPGAAPYVAVGMEIMAGQVIGLIEAMKLFNEIKSDATGRVVRLHATDGTLVRAKQPLVEIEPTI